MQQGLASIDLVEDANNSGDEEVGEVEVGGDTKEAVYKGEMSNSGSAYANVDK